MIPFLKSIARAYAMRYPDISEICFLFPNKRSGTFFIKYLKEEMGRHVYLSPEVKTITEFVADLSGRVVASRLDLLFMLYGCYKDLQTAGLPDNVALSDSGLEAHGSADPDAEAADFDNFRGWGETVLSDFDEVDRYMADAEEVFKNVKDYREISSNFLTEEQKAVMAEYFGRSDFSDNMQFWRDFDEEEGNLSDARRNFLYLWRTLWPLYGALKNDLATRGLASSGGAYRLAAENLRARGREMLPYKKIVAVGFNALSAAELSIFMEIRDFDGYDGYDSFGDFFWDATGSVLGGGDNSASHFVKANIKSFPSPAWASHTLSQSDNMELPRLRVVASPSNAAQTKIAGTLLSDLGSRLSSGVINDARVAVVLPDENLLLPMLYSLPEGMGNVNLTMGYPLRLTSVVPFVRHLRLLYRNRRTIGDCLSFYHRDLRLWLSHPFSHAALGSGVVNSIIGYIDHHHKSLVSIDEIARYSSVAACMLDFSQIDERKVRTCAFIDGVLAKVSGALESANTAVMKSRLEIDHITVYRDALRQLGDLLEEYRLNPSPVTVFHLVDKLLAGQTVGFEGEPLTGLQVMGTLETRSIDFDHIFILSMNERVMPMRSRTRSFIPDSLRHAYGMPPSNYSESIFAYYFYRMISRAKSVTMIYDSRSGGGLRGGDISRYILQLRHLFAPGLLEEQNWKFTLSGKETYDADVRLTPEMEGILHEYEKEGGKNLSSSSLKSYRKCEVSFFYKYVMGLNDDPSPSEYIDAIEAGDILHKIMEHLYLPEELRGRYLSSPVVIDKDRLLRLSEDKEGLWKITTRIVNRLHFKRRDEELDTPLTGAAELVASQIMKQAIRVITHDMKLAPFRLYGCEIEETMRIGLPSGRVVNFKFAIDRLDEITSDGRQTLRVVDYKTGSIHLQNESLENVLRGDYRGEQAFQLFTYAWLLQKKGLDRDGAVMMEIYDVPRIFKDDLRVPEIGGEKVRLYGEFRDGFSKGIEEMIDNIFESDEFRASGDEGGCRMCAFRRLCHR